MKRPSRARRESATTTLKNGRFLAPPRAKRITTIRKSRRKAEEGVILRYFLAAAQSRLWTPKASHAFQFRRFRGTYRKRPRRTVRRCRSRRPRAARLRRAPAHRRAPVVP